MLKKMLSFALVIIMIFSLAIPAFAASEPSGVALSEDISLNDLTADQVKQLTSLIKSRAVAYSTIKFNLDRSVFYDPILTAISYNGDGTYNIDVRSGFTFLFYYTAKIYKASGSEKIVDIRFVDDNSVEHETTENIDNPDELYRYDNLITGLIAYLINYVKTALSNLIKG